MAHVLGTDIDTVEQLKGAFLFVQDAPEEELGAQGFLDVGTHVEMVGDDDRLLAGGEGIDGTG